MMSFYRTFCPRWLASGPWVVITLPNCYFQSQKWSFLLKDDDDDDDKVGENSSKGKKKKVRIQKCRANIPRLNNVWLNDTMTWSLELQEMCLSSVVTSCYTISETKMSHYHSTTPLIWWPMDFPTASSCQQEIHHIKWLKGFFAACKHTGGFFFTTWLVFWALVPCLVRLCCTKSCVLPDPSC